MSATGIVVPPLLVAEAPPSSAAVAPRWPDVQVEADGRAYALVRRALDVLVAATALVLLSPVLALMALLVKLEDGGPVWFSQARVGRGGRRFRFHKVRSMVVGAEARRDVERLVQPGTLRFKLDNDPRMTRVGRWLRRTSLDELPQLVNVLRGDMSLVGPRPPLPEEVLRYGPRELRRLAVAQGLTCLWQVEGRSLLPFPRQVELDLEYVARRGLLLDLWILLRTVPAVLTGRGAW